MNTTEAIQNFVSAVDAYRRTGVWPDNYTLCALADCGREAIKELAVLRADNARLQSENDEWNCIFDLTHAAQARALLRWREQDPEGRRLKLPNIEDHTIWCFERIETLTADNARLREALEDLLHWHRSYFRNPTDYFRNIFRDACDKARDALANDSEKLKGS